MSDQTQTHTHHHEHTFPPEADGCGSNERSLKRCECSDKKILTIRSFSGLSGDMTLCGLAKLLGLDQAKLDEVLERIGPQFKGTVRIIPKDVRGIGGWHAEVSLPHVHEHRTMRDICEIIRQSKISEEGKKLSIKTFEILARAEAEVHGVPQEKIHFHEVGALDSILDICASCEMFSMLNPVKTVCSPLPIGDGAITCQHGVIPSPAPAVQRLLSGVSVKPLGAEGESVTPTAIALLKAFDAKFGEWPEMLVENCMTAYGTKTFDGIPNGALFVYGTGS